MVSISNSFRFREADLNVIGSLHFLLPLFESSFGREYTLGEPCEIYNDSKSSCPELQICYQPIRIRLSLDKTGYWNQLIFQLSHELCHYVLRQYRLNTFYSNACLSWYEEIACTAFSWCALKYAAVNWHNCVLSKQCPDYSQYMSSYLTHELGKPCNHCFSCCNTIDFVANNCSLPFRMEYLAMSASVSEQSTMPIVGLSPSLRFSSSYIRMYISI